MIPSRLLPILSVNTAKLVSNTIKLSGMGMASNLPGKIAIKICPHILPYLSGQFSQGCVAVTGTNGKSTTSGLLSSILRVSGLKIIHNREGANLLAGITSTLIEAAQLNGRLTADLGLFEVDEAVLPVLAKQLKLKYITVTNLFRDQLDRYGELDKTAILIAKGIETQNSSVILNADDPNVCSLPAPANKFYYGLNISSNYHQAQQNTNTEISYCPRCGREIKYEQSTEGISLWQCSSCTYSRPKLNLYASEIELLTDSSNFMLSDGKESISITLPLPGLFNIYNATAASATARVLGIDFADIKEGLEHYQTLFGRSEKLTINNRHILIQLIKNPAGASKTLNSLADSQCAKVLIAINDNLADGRDVSWLWDADFEVLANMDTSFIVSGIRAEDMAVRLKYAGVNSNKIQSEPNLIQALRQAIKETPIDKTLWILPTYTALLDLQKILKRLKRGININT